MTTKKHVVCVGFHASEAYAVDFGSNTVTAVMPKGSAARLPDAVAAKFASIKTLDLPDSDDLDNYDRAVDVMQVLVGQLIDEFGPPSAIIGLYEHTTLPAAKLRDHFGVPGTNAHSALLCRDKVAMKQALAAKGIRVPRHLAVGQDTPLDELERFARSWGGRCVLKPRSQGASIGVRVLDTVDELLTLARSGGIEAGYEVEEFVDGSIYHSDGVVRDGVLRWYCPARYVTTAYAFQHERTPMVCVTPDDRALVRRMFEYAQSVCDALGLVDSAFHLELFHTPDDGLVFLEIGNRFGGAGVPVHLREVFGVDMPREAVLACLDEPSELTAPPMMVDFPGVAASGWVFVPLNEPERCEVVAVHGLDDLPATVVHAVTPAVGEIVNDPPDTWNTAGRFFVVGESTAAVERDLAKIAETYSITTKTGD
jgi:biotin carboxylase